MKFSEAWLRQWVNPSLDSDELLFQMTMAGWKLTARSLRRSI